MGSFLAPFNDGYDEPSFSNGIGAAADSAKLDWGKAIFLAGFDVGAKFAVREVYDRAGVQFCKDFGG